MALFKKVFTLLIICVGSSYRLAAQSINTGAGSLNYDPHATNTITTAVPFLRIIPDARAGGMGDVGIATPVDGNGIYTNSAKMAFISEQDTTSKNFGAAVSYTPWLKALVNNIYLLSGNGYVRIEKKQVLSASFRYFSLGNIEFTNIAGTPTGQFTPHEFAADLSYARILSKYFSIAGSLRFIYSDLATGQIVNGMTVKAGMAGAGDIAWYFHKTFNENDEHRIEHQFAIGMVVSNLGNKMSYTSLGYKDFLPANLGIGLGYTLGINGRNSVGVYADFNKLLVPSPNTRYDSTKNTYFSNEESVAKAIFTSFGDAPALEELREITTGIGMEYYYNKQFGARFGYFYEHPTAGDRQFFEVGGTAKFHFIALHFSYLIPTTFTRNPLDNTFRISLLFDYAKSTKMPNDGGRSFAKKLKWFFS